MYLERMFIIVTILNIILYTCALVNSSNNSSDTQYKIPTSNWKPITIFIRDGYNVSLECPSFDGMSMPRVALWLAPTFNKSVDFNTTVTQKHIEMTSEYLRIENASVQDEGIYACKKNNESTSWSVVWLGTPVVPTPVRLSSQTQSSILLSWLGNNVASSLLQLEINITSPSGSKAVNVSAASGSCTIDKLLPYSKYYVYITPSDPLGPGNAIFHGSVCTGPGTPSLKPSASLSAVENTSAVVNITIPKLVSDDDVSACPNTYKPHDLLLGPFQGFRLTVETLNPPRVVRELNNNRTSFRIVDLLPSTEYRLNVSVSNGRFFGPPASENFTTTEGLPKPPKIIIVDPKIDSLRVKILKSDDRSKVIGYQVRWADCSESSTTTSADTEETIYTVIGLKSSTCYQVQAAAKTVAGLGNFSLLALGFTRCPDFPPPTLENVTATAEGIMLSWTANDLPSLPDGSHRFVVCLHIADPKKCQDVIFTPSQLRPVNGTRIYHHTLPFRDYNHLLGADETFNFTVQSVCLPRDCKPRYPCETLSANSNTMGLNFEQLTEILARRGPFAQLSDKAIGGIIGAVFAIVLLICCFGPLSLLYCRSTRPAYKRRTNLRLVTTVVAALGDDMMMPGGADDLRTPLVTPTMRRFEDSPHQPIPADHLARHVSSYHTDDDAGYQAEFEAIEQSVRTSWPTSVARLPENVPKNRYSNVFAYDHTRVALKNPHGRRSDYINANYVDGFRRPKAFIAAQGPKDITFDDFWQMVWDENSNIIVMISNFVERGRRKCDQYWPSEGQQMYGSISVKMVSENFFACYVARVFIVKNVKCKKFTKERYVRHYQYTDWRDFDVPPSPLPVLVFVKTTVKDWTPNHGPIIVHCSAGVGRTGTYICIESLIRQLEAEKQVNIRGFLEHIRQQRMKLVQTEQQYAFIHDALREYLLCPEHEVGVTSFAAYAQCLREVDASSGLSGIQKHFAICTDYHPRAYEFSEAHKPCNESKNRLIDLIPTDCRRVTLPTEPGVEGSSYINASIVQGYRRLQEFIVAQHPLPNTEADFWKMVWDKNSPVVFVLSSEGMSEFWPTEPMEPRLIGWLRVGFCSSDQSTEGLTRYEFLLSSSREDYALTCTLWRLHSWPTTVADTRRDFLKLQSMLVSDHGSTASGSAIVVDDYGGHRAGAFCAVNVLINQVTLSGSVDVYFIVKMLHLQRTGIFKSCEDLEFIYSVMEQFLSEMQQPQQLDDNNSFLGNDSSCSGYANLSIFNGKVSTPTTTTSRPLAAPAINGICCDSGHVETSLIPLLLSSEEEQGGGQPEGAALTTTTLELNSLTISSSSSSSSISNVAANALSPSFIGILTTSPKTNGYVVTPPPPPPPVPPPSWTPSDDLTPVTSLLRSSCGGAAGGGGGCRLLIGDDDIDNKLVDEEVEKGTGMDEVDLTMTI